MFAGAHKMRVYIGSDHAGYRLKEALKKALKSMDDSLVDVGCHSESPVDYPDIAFKVASAVSKSEADRGILICGTGIGMSIAANKFKGVRAAVCWSVETARLSRLHNDANILCLGGRILEPGLAARIVEVWLTTRFEGGRHLRRIEKIASIEKGRNEV